jgi:hypothetical protein
MVIITVYVYLYIVVYLYISGMGQNVWFPELFGFTPCPTFVHSEYRAFVLSSHQA